MELNENERPYLTIKYPCSLAFAIIYNLAVVHVEYPMRRPPVVRLVSVHHLPTPTTMQWVVVDHQVRADCILSIGRRIQ